jgi:type VI secretion system secreted protein Hcp
MAVDMFLRVDTLEGESEDHAHAKEIAILSWEWAASQTGTSGIGGGSGTGRVEHQDILIRKYVDRASPVLYFFCAKGEHIPTADLTVRKAGGEALEYLKIHLEDLMISSFVLGGDPKNDQVLETIRINFSRAAITYTQQVAAGGGDAAVTKGWDLKGNKEFTPPG